MGRGCPGPSPAGHLLAHAAITTRTRRAVQALRPRGRVDATGTAGPVRGPAGLGGHRQGHDSWLLSGRTAWLHTSRRVCKSELMISTVNLAATLSPVGRDRVTVRTSDRVYDELVNAIRTLRIPPGASLSETELAGQLHVSRTPLREAIARLVDNGLVSVVPQVGTRVELIRLADVELARFVRKSLELAAFAVACGKPTRDVGALRSLLAEQERARAEQDLDAFFEADEALHEQIFEMSDYPGAWTAMQPMKLQLDRLRRLSLPEPSVLRELIDEHAAIVDAVEASDVRRGQRCLAKHVDRVHRYGNNLRDKHPGYFAE